MTNPSRAPDRETRFSALYQAAYADLVRFAQRRVQGHAEDVVAEAFLVAWRRMDEVPEQLVDARAWLFGVARHAIMNTQRGAERRRALAVRLATAPSVSAGGDADLVAQQVDLAKAWDRLSAVHQEALALVVLDDLAAPQAAVVLGISPVAFRLRLSRARRALRMHLDHRPDSTLAPAERQSS
ncbi:sigma-70 family RNA polymerase sigma factor [Kribbella qitaiheensis]|uniref:Sigma-70 family RNA polymerase sigma factor n=1 Tax=Kribbella qitaiheensis TaxID=1544730 RepID=A0A7G6WY64_9ACTN|nr:sigma-70 family RNA polymerase sigma factor [Kribbella qitaiheensis]QNE18929.1 sigma-70 family RNA polymerase sigma factor [Kribbella qitaiheensis]